MAGQGRGGPRKGVVQRSSSPKSVSSQSSRESVVPSEDQEFPLMSPPSNLNLSSSSPVPLQSFLEGLRLAGWT